MADELEFLAPTGEDEKIDAPAQADAPQETHAEAKPQERPRGPDGKFASAAPPAVPVDAEKPAATPPATPTAAEPGHVPLSALLDEREQRQAAQKQLAALQSQQPRPDAPQIQDPAVEARFYVQNREFSRRLAVKEYGAEAVSKVHAWAVARCDEDPIFNQQIMTSDDPYEAVMQAWKREQLLAQVSPDDLDEYTAWKAAKAASQTQPQTQIPAAQTPTPRSLATAPGNGSVGHSQVSVSEQAAYDALDLR